MKDKAPARLLYEALRVSLSAEVKPICYNPKKGTVVGWIGGMPCTITIGPPRV